MTAKATGIGNPDRVRVIVNRTKRKPIGDLNSVPHYRCPCCYSAIVVYENDNKMPQCKWCGQAIDWSEEE